jgi:hypothetical protein
MQGDSDMTVGTPRWNQNELDFITGQLEGLSSQGLSQRERAYQVWQDFRTERQTNLMLHWRSKESIYHAVRRIERAENARRARLAAETSRTEVEGVAVTAS